MEKIYIGTKIIAAEPMDECTFLKKFKGQDVTNQETRSGYKVRYEDGYVSWSPKETFERAYREMTATEMAMILIPDYAPKEGLPPGKSPSDLPEDLRPKE